MGNETRPGFFAVPDEDVRLRLAGMRARDVRELAFTALRSGSEAAAALADESAAHAQTRAERDHERAGHADAIAQATAATERQRQAFLGECQRHRETADRMQEYIAAERARADRAERERDEARYVAQRETDRADAAATDADAAESRARALAAQVEGLVAWVQRGGRVDGDGRARPVDHACGRCVPGGSVVRDGWLCAWSAALAAPAPEPRTATLTAPYSSSTGGAAGPPYSAAAPAPEPAGDEWAPAADLARSQAHVVALQAEVDEIRSALIVAQAPTPAAAPCAACPVREAAELLAARVLESAYVEDDPDAEKQAAEKLAAALAQPAAAPGTDETAPAPTDAADGHDCRQQYSDRSRRHLDRAGD